MNSDISKLLFTTSILILNIFVTTRLIADDAVPIAFKDGDVISADVMNNLLSRLNSTTKIPSAQDMIGTWDCIETRSGMGNSAGYISDIHNLIGTRSNLLTIGVGANSQTFTFDASAGAPFEAHNVGNYYGPVVGGVAVLANGTRLFSIAKLGLWQANYVVSNISNRAMEIRGSGGLWEGSMVCSKINIVPPPVNELTATLNNSTVLLTWIDQSSNETGFKVQRKTQASASWITIHTTSENITSFSDINLTAGSYWYRVLATNGFGDSISSSVVRIVKP